MLHSVRIRRQAGQTIVIALIVMLLLLILGFVFAGILNRTIRETSRQTSRFRANDLGEAGVKYALDQLVNSDAGADWRGAPADLGVAATSTDPDLLYLRPGNPALVFPGKGYRDKGGPDGLGFFTRVPFENGRALIRVRYSAVDPNALYGSVGTDVPAGNNRSFLVIDSVGRAGKVDPRDPTTLGANPAVPFRGFGSQAALDNAIAQMKEADNKQVNVRKLRAFATVGITDDARFITNIHRVTRPAEIGIPNDLGGIYEGDAVTALPDSTGNRVLFQALGTPGTPFQTVGNVLRGFGSLRVNGDLMVHGTVRAHLNPSLGDGISVAGAVRAADDQSELQVDVQRIQRTGPTTAPTLVNGGQVRIVGPNLDSNNPNFSTLGGIFRDGVSATDAGGFNRGIGYREPPIVATGDDADRYLRLTRDSGRIVNGANVGLYGHGRNVFVDNGDDRQVAATEAGREAAQDSESLIYDWLNPNNQSFARTGWRGGFYIPRGAELRLVNDGFAIIRDPLSGNRTWRAFDGADTGRTVNRYRLGRGTDGRIHVVNSFTPGVGDVTGNLTATQFDLGPEFGGVLYFAGNVRVRGVIPTDVQLTVVSGATVYIEGSVVKGVVGNQITATGGGPAVGVRLARPSGSLLGLFARDYVAVNPTMFFGPTAGQPVEVKADVPGGFAYSPVKVENGSSLELGVELPLDPDGRRLNGTPSDPTNPSTWDPSAATYRSGNAPIRTQMLVTHTAEEGVAPTTIGMNINAGLFDSPTATSPYHFFPPTTPIPATEDPSPYLFSLGDRASQRYARFEAGAFPLVDPDSLDAGEVARGFLVHRNVGSAPTPELGLYGLLSSGAAYDLNPDRQTALNRIATRVTGNGYLLARATLVPADVRIEAAIYAQEGSFFVIPGPWFNPNPDDTREKWAQDFAAAPGSDAERRAIADDRRLQDFGSFPAVPFYAEPVDVKVTLVGAVAENMPAPISQQAEYLRKWGWIPQTLGATGVRIPDAHRRGQSDPDPVVSPNFGISYDGVLGTGRTTGFLQLAGPQDLDVNLVRRDEYGRPLPPLPRLPVSPQLAYFGDAQ